MALTLDTVSSFDNLAGGTTTSPWTLSHVVASGTGNILIVKVAWYGALGDITGVTYNSVAMTQIGATARGTTLVVSLYKLVTPSVGTYNVVASFSPAPLSGAIFATCWSGADTGGTPNGAYAATTGGQNATPLTLSSISTGATETVNDLYFMINGSTSSTVAASPDASQTSEAVLSDLVTNYASAGTSYKVNGTSMIWTEAGMSGFAAAAGLCAVSLKPAPVVFAPSRVQSAIYRM